MKEILITGGAGFIGINLLRYILSQESDAHITIAGTFTSEASRRNFVDFLHTLTEEERQRCSFFAIDITNPTELQHIFSSRKIDTVIHLAMLNGRAHTESEVRKVNVVGTKMLLDMAAFYGVDTFYYQSTGLVYDTTEPDELRLVDEDTPLHPEGIYAETKALAENVIHEDTSVMRKIIGRICNVYGPWQDTADIVPSAIRALLKGEKLSLTGDGKQRRQFLYVDDACRAIWELVMHGENGQTYNIASVEFPTIHEVAATILLGLPNAIELHTDNPGRSAAYMDTARLQKLLPNWPSTELAEGLSETVSWHSKRYLQPERELPSLLPHQARK